MAHKLKSPFDTREVVDTDIRYTAYALARMGPFLKEHIDDQLKCFNVLIAALEPWEQWTRTNMSANSAAVAAPTATPASRQCDVCAVAAAQAAGPWRPGEEGLRRWRGCAA